MHHPTDRIAHTTVFVTPVMVHWLEWETAQWVHHEESIWRPTAPLANTLTTEELHLAPWCMMSFWSFRLTARVLLHAPSHRQDCPYHSLFTPVVEWNIANDTLNTFYLGLYFRIAARNVSHISPHRPDSTHTVCNPIRGALARMRNN